MGTDIIDKNGFQVTRFWGGSDRGVCFQLNKEGQYIVLSKADMIELVARMLSDIVIEVFSK